MFCYFELRMKELDMEILLAPLVLTAAIEYSLLYMLGGGGIVGAVVIFIVAKMLRR